jgi:hypothetical protein
VNEPVRVVSLLASGTELVCALGLGERLVGRSPAISAEMLHPEHFEPRHEGIAWARHR